MQTQDAARAHELGRLATEHRRADRPADALQAARQAHAVAASSRDEHARAYASFVLGTTLLDEWHRGADILFREALQRLDEAAASTSAPCC